MFNEQVKLAMFYLDMINAHGKLAVDVLEAIGDASAVISTLLLQYRHRARGMIRGNA